MNKEAKNCEHPGLLKGNTEECSQEQIKKCHGTGNKHSCTIKKEA